MITFISMRTTVVIAMLMSFMASLAVAFILPEAIAPQAAAATLISSLLVGLGAPFISHKIGE